MSAVEDAQALRSQGQQIYEALLSSISNAIDGLGKVTQALGQLTDIAADGQSVAAGHLGEGHANLNDIRGAVAAFTETLSPAQANAEQLATQLFDLQARAGQVSETFDAAASVVGGQG